jgi:RNA polymerase sigma factor (sigma-70 family)
MKFLMPNYGHRLCNDRDFLKDCIQDLFVDVWNRREQLQLGEQFKGYLFKALRNNIFHEQSKISRRLPLADEHDFKVEFDVEYQQIITDSQQELTEKVKRTLEHLPSRQKEVLYLRYFEGLPFDDIAEILEISKQSSHNLLQKSYKSFREKWEITSEAVIAVSVYLIFYYS